jgi:hypothetical protein
MLTMQATSFLGPVFVLPPESAKNRRGERRYLGRDGCFFEPIVLSVMSTTNDNMDSALLDWASYLSRR